MTLVTPLLTSDDQDSCVFYKVYLGIILSLSTVAMLLIGWWTLKFIRIFRFKKKLQMWFLFLVFGSTIARVANFSFELYWRGEAWSVPPDFWTESSIYWLSSTLFSSAIVISIFSWIYQLLRIKKFQTGERQYQIPHHIAFGSFLAIVFFSYFGFVFTAWLIESEEMTVFRMFKILYSCTFLLIGVTYIVVAVVFYKNLKKILEEQAKSMKTKIIISVIVISSSFLTRAILNLGMYMFNFNARFNRHWLTENQFWFPLTLTFYFLLSEILPTLYIWMSIKSIEKQLHRKNINWDDFNLGITKNSVLHETLRESQVSRTTLGSTKEVINS